MMYRVRWKAIVAGMGVVGAIAAGAVLVPPRLNRPPYPRSALIRDVELDWSTHRRLAPGSGDWGITWADDDHQYTAWGNGGGFGGTNDDGRVFLGFARVEGSKDDYRAFNVWGGKNAENPATFGGKSYAPISVGGTMYMWLCGDTDGVSAFKFQQLYVSPDHSRTWLPVGVEFTPASFPDGDLGFFCPIFLQFGRDYAGARDQYVYIYATEVKDRSGFLQKPGGLALMRVPIGSITQLGAYEYFAGLDASGAPQWTSDLARRRPVFEDPTGLSHPNALYNPGLGRYILLMEHSRYASGNLAIYEGPEPWGPWSTVRYEHDFGWPRVENNGFMWVIPTKWLSADGTKFVIILTGRGDNDSWNSIEGRFVLAR